jgi:hypothetical protein
VSDGIREHRCAHCYVAQYGMKSNLPCKNEWWELWDFLYGQETPDSDDPDFWGDEVDPAIDRIQEPIEIPGSSTSLNARAEES